MGHDPAIERFLLDQVQAAVVATDPDGTVIHWNTFAEQLFGYASADAAGRPLAELIAAPTEGGRFHDILKGIARGEPWEGELLAITKEGRPVPTRLRASPTHDRTGAYTGMAVVIVDITDIKRSERRLAAQYAVTRVLAEAEDLPEATPRILEALGENLDWQMGAIWEVDETAGVLLCVATWQASGDPKPEFDALTQDRTFPPGVGLPGRIWADRRPLWIPDVVEDENFPRATVAAREGLHSAFGFPIVLGQELMGVIEFFSPEIREPDQELLWMVASVGSQIGQFIERKDAERAVRESESRTRAIVEGAFDCIITVDHEARIVEFNPAAEETFGYRRDEVLGKDVADVVIPPSLRDRHRQAFGRYLRTGTPGILDRRLELTGMRADGSEFPVELTITEIKGGRFPMFSGYLRDITEPKQSAREREHLLALEHAARQEAEAAKERVEFLAEASRVLASSLDYRKNLHRVVRLAVPRLADWCSVQVLDDDEIRVVATAHADPVALQRAEEVGRRWAPDPDAGRGVPNVLRTGRSELYADIPDSLLAETAHDPEHLAFLRGLGIHSAMVVPLTARGRTFGAITFVAAESGRRYSKGDLELAEELAWRAAQAVDNARLFQERTHVARALQRSLLPQRLPELEWCEIAARYRAAGEGEVGGDFYDVFEAGDGAWFAAVGDVQGKGPEAAAITGLARYTIKAAAVTQRNPSRILRMLNGTITREGTDRFATVALARLQRRNDAVQVAISCGGHPTPFLVRATGEVEATDCLGTLLGVFPEPELHDALLELSPGDALVFYTDGVTEEPRGGEMFGESRLVTVLRESAGADAERMARRIEEAVLAFREEEPRDDMALLVIRIRPEGVAPSAQPV